MENVSGKGENVGFQHFFPFFTIVSSGFFLRTFKVRTELYLIFFVLTSYFHVYFTLCVEEMKPRQDLDFTGVVGRIRRWRPPCFFGGRQDSDSEEEAVEDPLDDLPPPEPLDGKSCSLFLHDT